MSNLSADEHEIDGHSDADRGQKEAQDDGAEVDDDAEGDQRDAGPERKTVVWGGR